MHPSSLFTQSSYFVTYKKNQTNAYEDSMRPSSFYLQFWLCNIQDTPMHFLTKKM